MFCAGVLSLLISIHAPREGGDTASKIQTKNTI